MDEMDADPLAGVPLHEALSTQMASQMQVAGLSGDQAQELADSFLGAVLAVVAEELILHGPRDVSVEALAVQLVRHIWPELVEDYEFGQELGDWVSERQKYDGGPT